MRIVVCDPAAPYREALAKACRSIGFEVEEPDDLLGWAAGGARDRLAALTVRGEADWQLLDQLASQVEVVALLPDLDPEAYRQAITAGAVAVADWAAPSELIASTIEAASRGEVRLPSHMAYRLLAPPTSDHATTPPDLTQEELRWLKALSQGVSVRRLHQDEFQPERSLYRHLQNLYIKLGAHNRAQAIARAAQLGLLD